MKLYHTSFLYYHDLRTSSYHTHDAKRASYKVYTIIQKLCINPIYGDTKSLKRYQIPSRYYNSKTNLSSFNTSQNTIVQKSSYKNRPIIVT
jgi:hypothetical protein